MRTFNGTNLNQPDTRDDALEDPLSLEANTPRRSSLVYDNDDDDESDDDSPPPVPPAEQSKLKKDDKWHE